MQIPKEVMLSEELNKKNKTVRPDLSAVSQNLKLKSGLKSRNN